MLHLIPVKKIVLLLQLKVKGGRARPNFSVYLKIMRFQMSHDISTILLFISCNFEISINKTYHQAL